MPRAAPASTRTYFALGAHAWRARPSCNEPGDSRESSLWASAVRPMPQSAWIFAATRSCTRVPWGNSRSCSASRRSAPAKRPAWSSVSARDRIATSSASRFGRAARSDGALGLGSGRRRSVLRERLRGRSRRLLDDRRDRWGRRRDARLRGRGHGPRRPFARSLEQHGTAHGEADDDQRNRGPPDAGARRGRGRCPRGEVAGGDAPAELTEHALAIRDRRTQSLSTRSDERCCLGTELVHGRPPASRLALRASSSPKAILAARSRE